MALIDAKNKAINAKLVYYGPGLCGKTTNLQYVNSKLVTGQELMSLATEGDRTIFFDFMPLDMGTIRGLSVKFKLYTVPGQVRYNQTRKMVLKNVDGVVFVADSQREMLDPNLESLDNLFENLEELGIDASRIPLILQYNKQDLPNAMSTAELDRHLNANGFRTFEASAVTGTGVVETLKAACVEVIKQLSQHFGEGEASSAANVRSAAAGGQGRAQSVTGTGARASSGAARPRTSPQPRSGGTRPWPAPRSSVRDKLASQPAPRADRGQPSDALGAVARVEDKLDGLRAALVEAIDRAAPPSGTVDQLRAALDRVRAELESSSHLHEQLKRALPGPGEFTGLRSQLIDVADKVKRIEAEVLPVAKELASLGKSMRALPSKADVGAMVAKAGASVPPPGRAAAGPSAEEVAKAARRAVEEGLGPVKRRLESLPAKADLEGLGKATDRLSSLPTRADLVSLGKALEAKLAPPRGAGGDAAASAEVTRSVERAVGRLIESRFAAMEEQLAKAAAEHAERAAREAATAVQKRNDALVARLEALVTDLAQRTERGARLAPAPVAAETAETREDEKAEATEEAKPEEKAEATEEAKPQDESAATEESKPGEKAEASEESKPEEKAEATEESKPEEPKAEASEESKPEEKAEASEESKPEEPKAEATEESKPEEKAEATEEAKPDEKAEASEESKPEEDLSDDPQHKNAARIARVMMADLYLYHRDEVEEGLRNDDFFDRNREALEDMRATYESRVPEDVRARKDHLNAAIEAFLDKKRTQLGL